MIIEFLVCYGEKTDITELARLVGVEEKILERAFRRFKNQKEVDFFINKDARGFLMEQLDLYLCQMFLEMWDECVAERIRRLKILKKYAIKIIDIIAKLEDRLVELWNAPRRVVESNYVITIDKLNDTILEKIALHENLKKQVDEWKELGMIDEGFDFTKREEKHKFLPIDTKYFKDLEEEILGLFDDVDGALDGHLIKSENYQALNTLLPKYRGRIQCIYIDPPYNTGSDWFVYKDDFKHSSWLTMMENRVSLAREFLSDDGVFFCSIDDKEVDNLRKIALNFFTEQAILKIRMRKPERQLTQKLLFQKSIEYCFCLSKTKQPYINLPKVDYDFSEYKYKIIEKTAPNRVFGIGKYKIEEFLPEQYEILKINDLNEPYLVKSISIRGKIKQLVGKFYEKNLRPIFEKNKNYGVLYKVYGMGDDGFGFRYIRNPVDNTVKNATYFQGIPKSIKQSIDGAYKEKAYHDFYDFEKEMNNESKKIKDLNIYNLTTIKPVGLVKFLIKISQKTYGDTILDFFAGSGSTAHAVINLNREDGGKRKYLLVEANECFDTVIVPRIKKVVFSENWKDGKAQDGKGISQFFKYTTLEQFEDVLRNVAFPLKENSEKFDF